MRKILFLVLLLSLPVAMADYCDLEFAPELTQNGTTFNCTIDGDSYLCNTTVGNVTSEAIIDLQCDQDKTFFVIANETDKVAEPESNITFNFIVSPVIFDDYVISSWGLFNISQKTMFLDDPYYFNQTYTVEKEIDKGEYTQTFEVTNGRQVYYLIYNIEVNKTLKPKILKVDLPEEVYVYKEFEIGVLVDNVDNVTVFLGEDLDFILENQTENYYVGNVYTDDLSNEVVIEAYKGEFEDDGVFDLVTFKHGVTIDNMIFPAIQMEKTNPIKLAEFDVDHPVDLKIKHSKGQIDNSTSLNYTYYFANDEGQVIKNEGTGKELWLYLNPQSARESKLDVEVESNAFSPVKFHVIFVGSNETNPREVDISYHNKPTHCTAKGTSLVDMMYECTFVVPYTYNVEKLETEELKLLEEGYREGLEFRDEEIKKLKTQRAIIIIGMILVLIIAFLVINRERVMILLGRFGK